jgi:lipoprotein-releasing system permease protein
VLPLRIAMRFLRSSRNQTILIILGLAVGIAVQLFVGLLLQNLQAGLLAAVTGSSSHVTVLPGEDQVFLSEWEAIVAEMEGVGGIDTISVTAESSAIVNVGQRSASIQLRGLVFDDADRIYGLREALYEGTPPGNLSQALLGKELAERLQLQPGDAFTVVTPEKDSVTYTVSGLYDLGVAGINERWVIVDLGSAQDTFRMGGNVTSIETQVRDVYAADATATKVERALEGRDVTVENWIDNNQDLFSAVSAQNSSSIMIQTFVMVSVLIGIASVLSITVLQKSRQIGILKAMGIRDRGAGLIFLFQGLFLGVGGAIAGMVLGSVLFLGFLKGLEASGDTIISSELNWPFIVLSGIIAILAAIFASLSPALKSRKLDPIEVIRSG